MHCDELLIGEFVEGSCGGLI